MLVAGATIAGVLAVAVQAHADGSLDRLLVATVALLALASFEVVTPLPAAARELSEAVSSGRRVLQLTDGRPAVRDPAEPRPPPRLPAVVTLEGVTARYGPDEAPALSGVDLTLAPGRRVALVGPSGAGKTTVTNLLLRFLDPEEGRVTVAGRDAREYRQADVRRLFALAGQEAHLFQASIRDNLLLARPRRDRRGVAPGARPCRPRPVDRRRCREGSTRSSASTARTSPADNGSASSSRARCSRRRHSSFSTSRARTWIRRRPRRSSRTCCRPRTTVPCFSITHRPEGLDRVDDIVRLADGRVTSDDVRRPDRAPHTLRPPADTLPQVG